MNRNVLYMPLLMALSLSALSPALAAGSQWRNGLPPTTMDSFVLQAKSDAEIIYGDEGTTSIPPYFGFEKCSRINAGIMDGRDQGLTTGHGSYMPDAAGRDEFLGQEWTKSGARGREAALGFQDGKPVVVAPRNALSPLNDDTFDLSFVGENDPAWEKR
jgi:hypothetical protein